MSWRWSTPFPNIWKICAHSILLLILLNHVTPSVQQSDDEAAVDDEILGLGKTIFIVICVVAGLVVVGILISFCFCCACLCFAGRKKSKTSQHVSVYQNQQSQQHQEGPVDNYNAAYAPQQQQPYGNPSYYNEAQQQHYNHSTDNAAAYGNNYNNHPPPYAQSQQQQSQYNSTSYQKSASPPRPDPYASIDQSSVHSSADPNLIPNRFKPTVPPKPKDRIPGWTAVTAEVKKRTQLNKAQPFDGYSNDGYDGYDGDSQIASPVPSQQPNHSQKSTTDNFMY